jgi:uncharacterized protein YndB with AHSA1/START domain
MGTTGSASVHITAPPDAIYGMISDVTRMGEWSPETRSCEWLDGASSPSVGARFRGTNKRKLSWKTTATVTAADPAREFAFAIGKSAPGNPETTWRYTLTTEGGGTDVTEWFEINKTPGPIGKWLAKLATGVSWDQRPADMEQGMHQTLEQLKAVAEGP